MACAYLNLSRITIKTRGYHRIIMPFSPVFPENLVLRSYQWVSGTELIKRFDLPEAMRFAKCFCTECGSAVPHVTGDGQLLLIPAGLLEDDPLIRPQDKIFWKDRAEWHDDAMIAPCFDSYPT